MPHRDGLPFTGMMGFSKPRVTSCFHSPIRELRNTPRTQTKDSGQTGSAMFLGSVVPLS
jgi:hypothetical protein